MIKKVIDDYLDHYLIYDKYDKYNLYYICNKCNIILDFPNFDLAIKNGNKIDENIRIIEDGKIILREILTCNEELIKRLLE